jgi:hypothetical protein
VPALSEGCGVPGKYCVSGRSDYRPRELKAERKRPRSKDKILFLYIYYQIFIVWFAHISCPERKDFADLSPIQSCYCSQWKSLLVRAFWRATGSRTTDGPGQNTASQAQGKTDILKLHVGFSGGHLDINKALDMIRQKYCWLQLRSDVGRWCELYGTCPASHAQTWSWGLLCQ